MRHTFFMHTKLPQERRDQLATQVNRIVEETPVFDIHTHLYDPAFGSLLLHGIDELLTYHYLVAELFRFAEIPIESFWKLTKTAQADLIWKHLFADRSPLSESCRGVLTTLHQLGLDVGKKELPKIRKWYAEQTPEALVEQCLCIAKVDRLCMTNSPFDPQERKTWQKGFVRDSRFVSALRIDPILDWQKVSRQIAAEGFSVQTDLNPSTFVGLRRFLDHWTQTFKARYLMLSLPPSFQYPAWDMRLGRIRWSQPSWSQVVPSFLRKSDLTTTLLDEVIIPHCIEKGLPLALMLGAQRAVNPQLRLAGDGMRRADLSALEHLCQRHPKAKFLCTVLSKENQHELCVLARKFPNLHLFGCWWFSNIPCVIDEITRLRFELLGLSITPQHSDARVLDQLIYKWEHSRKIVANILIDKYADLECAGWKVDEETIRGDVRELFGAGFERFCNR